MKHIVLVNYGGPQHKGEVKDYLYRLFSDRNIIQLPAVMRKPLAVLISHLRAKRVEKNYESIGGSPLFSLTQSLVHTLNQNQHRRYYLAMAYTPPFIPQIIDSIPDKEVYIFPLFPHYSLTTTGTCLSSARKSSQRIFYLKEYWFEPSFNQLITERIRQSVDYPEKTAVLFSAHSIPLKYAKKGDPYLKSTWTHFNLLQKKLSDYNLFLGFQSGFGPLQWAGPKFMEVVAEIEKKGFKKVIVFPLSFTVDNYETEYEIDVVYRNNINYNNKLEFTRLSCLNNKDDFVSFIQETVMDDRKWLELQ
ncbi:ferrochelatase [bacterium]|nr:ferrochelatase [bacterium]